MKYTELIPGQVYKGIVTGATGNPYWIFQYSPSKKEKTDNEGNKAYHYGIVYDGSSRKIRKSTYLWCFERGWEFSEATYEEISLLGIKQHYEIY